MAKHSSEDTYQVARNAFLKMHQGYSVDEIIITDQLNSKFIDICKIDLPEMGEFDFNWALLNMRKQGKLGRIATKRKTYNYDDYIHASEIAARLMYDKYNLSVDRVLCNPSHRKEFDSISHDVAPDISAYLLRRAALKLRKMRKLRPEFVVRVASWDKQVLVFSGEDISQNINAVPQKPGIYIFRDHSGYLYIGESKNLRVRVGKHLDHSDRKSLAHYLWKNNICDISVELHVFDPDSEGRLKQKRRAYEADLIQSRQPRLNIRD